MTNTGWHTDIPSEAYHRLPGASSTRLNRLRETCPAKVRYDLDHPEEPTPALALGAAAHDCILLPDQFDERYIVCDAGLDRRTKEGKAAYAALLMAANGRTILKNDAYETCIAMRKSIASHAMAARLLATSDGVNEISGIWTAANGCPCRIRPDRFAEVAGVPMIVDIKTTENASHAAFIRSGIRLGYHRQAAFYLRGAAALGRAAEKFIFVAVEKSPPYQVAVYAVPDELVELGESQIEPLLATWAECERSGVWPGYPNDIITLEAPAWAFREEF